MKRWKNIARLALSFMCMFMLFSAGKITSRAVAGTLYEGKSFNAAIKQFVNEKANWTTSDNKIKNIVFALQPSSIPSSYKKVAVGDKVNAYYSAADATVYVYYTAKISFSENCDSMFRDLTALQSINFGTGIINTVPMTSADSMFKNCESLKKLDLTQFSTPNVTKTSSMFQGCLDLEELNVKTLNTAKVTDMHAMFMTCPSLTALDISSFKTNRVTQMYEMFENCTSLKSLDLKNFDTNSVQSMYRMFSYCTDLATLNISSFKTPNLINVREMFAGCENIGYLNLSGFDVSKVTEENAQAFLGNCDMLQSVDAPKNVGRNFAYDDDSKYITDCKIGTVAIDDNKDGTPDSAAVYTYFLKSTVTHRYLFLDGIERLRAKTGAPAPGEAAPSENGAKVETPAGSKKVKVKGITYVIGSDGKATVTKISSVKKANINTVTVNGIKYPVTKIGDSCCQWNKKLKSLSIGSNVEVIGKNAFYGSGKLKKISINVGKKFKVEHGAFKKINRRASFKLKGVKGKDKKKLLKKLKK